MRKFRLLFTGISLLLLAFVVNGYSEGSKQLNTACITMSTNLYLCNDFTNHCNGTGGIRSQFAVYNATQSATPDNRLYFVTNSADEVVLMGFQKGTTPNGTKIVFRIKDINDAVVYSEQDLPTASPGYIAFIPQACNGPNQTLPPPANTGYNAISWNPPSIGTFYIEFALKVTATGAYTNNQFNIDLFDITIYNTVTSEVKAGRLYSKSWQFSEASNFTGINYVLSDDGIVTSMQFNNMDGGAWIQYANQTGCGNSNWVTDRKSLYHQQALFPQYKVFLNSPDQDVFPIATTLGNIIPPDPYGERNCDGTVDFYVNVDKGGNVEIDLTFNPATYTPRVLSKVVAPGLNSVHWDGKDGNNVNVPNNVSISFTVKYINGLTNLPLYDVEGNSSGLLVSLVAPAGAAPNVYWDDSNIWAHGANSADVKENYTTGGCPSTGGFPGCHKWPTSWGDQNTINSWWYTVSTSASYPAISEWRSPQTLVYSVLAPSLCAGATGVVISVIADPNTEEYHWSYTGTGIVTFLPSATTTLPTVTVNFDITATSGDIVVYGTNTNCNSAPSPPVHLVVTLHASPIPTISGPATVCNMSMTNNYFTEAGNNTYDWAVIPDGSAISGGTPTDPTATIYWSSPGIKTVSVTYHNTYGCAAVNPAVKIVTVNPLPTATISGTTSVCQNSTPPDITFTGGAATAPYTFTYTIDGGPDQTITTISGNSVTLAVPTAITGTFTYTLVSVQDGSATTCSQAQTGSAAVTVNPLPTATISGTTIVCQNSSAPLITFTGASTAAPYTFTYKINGGSDQTVTTTSGNSVTVSAPTAVAGTFTYSLVKVQDGSLTTCSQTQSGDASITVNPLPTATIAGTTAVCQNSASPDITFTGALATAPYTFTYKINGGSDQTVTTTSGNSVTVSVPTTTVGIFTYSLVSVQDASSTTCSQLQTGSAVVTVNPLPIPGITGFATVCTGVTGVLYSTESSMTGYSWTVSPGGAITSGSTTNTINVSWNSPGAQTVSVNYTNANGCLAASATVKNVTVNPLPTATVTGTASACQNSASPLITFTGGSATAPYTFTYNINGGAPQTVTTIIGNSVTVAAPTNVLGTFIYSLVSVQESSSTACSQSQTGSATVSVNLLPTASISGTTVVCQNSAAPLITFTGASTTAPYTFTYDINGGSDLTVTTISGNSVTVPAPTGVTGTFTYTLLSVHDGSATPCTQSQSGSAVITVNALPTATITGTTAVCQNSSAPLLTFTGASTTAPYTFTYKINGGIDQIVTTSVGSSVTIPAPTTIGGTFTYTLVSVQDGSATTCAQTQSGSAIVTVNPLPTATISGTTVVCRNSVAPPITFTGSSATAPYTFTYKINGGANQFVTTSAGNSVTVPASTSGVGTFIYTLVSVQDASSTACSQLQSGNATVTVNPLPFVDLSLCNDPKTTTTSKPFTLKGGVPPGGQYYIDGILAGGGIFNPAALSASTHLITYSFTDFNTCSSTSLSVPITVITGSPTGSCPATFIDPRDNHSYRAFTLGSHCWMLSNLNYGTKMASDLTPQSNNCAPEKYCLASDATCVSYGGLYQWDELMQYQVPAPGLSLQGLCPPEWHVPAQAEWQNLIDAVASMTPGDGLAGSYLKDTNPGFGFHVLLDGIFYLNNTWAFTSGNLTATMFWTSATSGPYHAIARGLNNYNYSVSLYPSSRANAFPVRCVKDF